MSVIVIIGLSIVKIIARASAKVLGKVGKLISYTLVLAVLQLAFGVFGSNPISHLITGMIAFLPKIFVAIVIIIVDAAIAAGVRTLIEGTLGGLSYGKFLPNVASVVILGLAIIAGVIIVGAGGGLIKPMQGGWDNI